MITITVNLPDNKEIVYNILSSDPTKVDEYIKAIGMLQVWTSIVITITSINH